jgi:hypothetical protein
MARFVQRFQQSLACHRRRWWCWGASVELGELVVGTGETDLEAASLAAPASPLGLDDASEQRE